MALQKDTGYSMFKESCRLLISSGCRARLLEDMMSSSACNFVYLKKFSVNSVTPNDCLLLSKLNDVSSIFEQILVDGNVNFTPSDVNRKQSLRNASILSWEFGELNSIFFFLGETIFRATFLQVWGNAKICFSWIFLSIILVAPYP